MAAGSLAEPGAEYGPCAEDCEHTDCEATRNQAKSECVTCFEEIGYGRLFFDLYLNDGPGPLQHQDCAYEEVWVNRRA